MLWRRQTLSVGRGERFGVFTQKRVESRKRGVYICTSEVLTRPNKPYTDLRFSQHSEYEM